MAAFKSTMCTAVWGYHVYKDIWAGFIWWATSDAWTWVDRVSWANWCIVCRLGTWYSSPKGQSSAEVGLKYSISIFFLGGPSSRSLNMIVDWLSSQSGPGVFITNSTELSLEQGRFGDDSRSKSIVAPKWKRLRQKKYVLCPMVCIACMQYLHTNNKWDLLIYSNNSLEIGNSHYPWDCQRISLQEVLWHALNCCYMVPDDMFSLVLHLSCEINKRYVNNTSKSKTYSETYCTCSRRLFSLEPLNLLCLNID